MKKILVLFGALLFFCVSSVAQAIPPSVEVGGKRYRTEELAADFSFISITPYIWNDNTFVGGVFTSREYYFGLKKGFFSKKKERNNFYSMKYPDTGVLNKWDEEAVKISILSSGDENFLNTVGDQATRVSGQISDLIGINFDVVDTGLDFRSKYRQYIRLNGTPEIIIASFVSNNERNPYKPIMTDYMELNLLSGHEGAWYRYFSFYYYGAVPFTVKAKGSVYGFLLPDPETNNIEKAVCLIDPTLSESVMRHLVNECLVRAMGLPEMSKVSEESYVGKWNHRMDSSLKIVADAKDQEEVTSWLKKDQNRKTEGFLQKTLSFLTPDDRAVDFAEGLHPYDRFMLSLLYCQKLKSGMNVYAVLNVLSSDDSNCFSFVHK